MANYSSAKFTGYGVITTDSDYVSEYLEIRDAYTQELLDTYSTEQFIEFNFLGNCETNLTVTPCTCVSCHPVCMCVEDALVWQCL